MASSHSNTTVNLPGWRRHRAIRWVAHHLYCSGITRSGGKTVLYGGRIAHYLPSWRDVRPRSGRLRPYVLWLPRWWWECQWRQRLAVRDRHRPREPYALGVCAACLPCWSCGEMYDCKSTCEVLTGVKS